MTFIENKTSLSLAIDNTVKPNQVPKKWIVRLFRMMTARYPFSWRKYIVASGCTVDEMQAMWHEDLKYTCRTKFRKVVKHVFKSGEFAEYPIQLPKMIKLCLPTPKDIGVLSDDEALELYLHPDTYKSNALVHKAGLKGKNSYRNYSPDVCRQKFLKAYHEIIQEALDNSLESIQIPAYLQDDRPIEERLGTESATHKPEQEFSQLSAKENRSLILKKLGMSNTQAITH